jgi:hypothetical protein
MTSEARNPKLEIRNSKQFQITKTHKISQDYFGSDFVGFDFGCFDLFGSFDIAQDRFRASDFGF